MRPGDFVIKQTTVCFEHYAPEIGDSLPYFPEITYVSRGASTGQLFLLNQNIGGTVCRSFTSVHCSLSAIC